MTATNNYTVLAVWGYPTNPYYSPDTANNGGGYWQYGGGAVVDIGGAEVVVDLWNYDQGDFGSWYGCTVEADGWCWWINSGTSRNAQQDYCEACDVVDSMSGVLGLDVADMLNSIEAVVNSCACMRWEADLSACGEIDEGCR